MWKNLLKILFSLMLLFLIFRMLDFRVFIEKLTVISIWGISGSLLLLIIQSLFASLRWKIIIKRYHRDIPFYDVVKIHYLSFGTSLFLPNAVAEPFWKSLLLKNFKLPVKSALLTVMLDKAFVVVGLFLMVLVVMPIMAMIYPVSVLFVCSYLSVLAILIILYIAYTFSGSLRVRKLLGKNLNKYPEVKSAFQHLLLDKGLLLKCLAITLLSQVSSITSLYVLSLFMQLDIKYYEYLLLIPPVFLLTMMPITFNGWGLREVSIIYMLGLINVPPGVALALSVQFGLIGMLVWGIGLLSWIRYKS